LLRSDAKQAGAFGWALNDPKCVSNFLIPRSYAARRCGSIWSDLGGTRTAGRSRARKWYS
jgi:hypothetical protein